MSITRITQDLYGMSFENIDELVYHEDEDEDEDDEQLNEQENEHKDKA